MRVIPWALGGGAAALAWYSWARRGRNASTPASDAAAGSVGNPPSAPELPSGIEPLAGRWVWPVGVWQGRKPEITDGFSSRRRTPAGDLIPHGGVDIMYRRLPGDAYRAGTPNGTPNFVIPDRRAALAASDGVVSFAAHTPRGWTVIVDHAPRKLATYYTHLSSLLVAGKQRVTAGTPLGIIGADPLDGQHLLHLHFELWRGGSRDRIDPQPLMARWPYLPDPAEPTSALVARNARAGGTRPLPARSAHTRASGRQTASSARVLPPPLNPWKLP